MVAVKAKVRARAVIIFMKKGGCGDKAQLATADFLYHRGRGVV